MDKILENNKIFEYLRDKHDPVYTDLIHAIDLVKKFIEDHNLIIYGGSAIDYALRLKGSKIYDDEALAFPDLDFYSPDNVKHSYQLADILYNKGYKSVCVIRAMYVRTMHVDLINNHFIADMTYCPEDVFKKLPTLKYNNMYIIHPEYQRIDLHSSLSFPYDNPPKEVIFARWSKDIKRWNILDKYYPIKSGPVIPLKDIVAPISMHKYTLTGFAAYAAIYAHWLELINILKLKKTSLTATTTAMRVEGSQIHFQTFDRILDIVHFDIEKASVELALTNASKYEPYFTMVYDTIIGTIPGDISVKLHSVKNRLISVNVIKLGDVNFKVVNVQALLRHFIAFAHASEGKLRNTYLSHYISLLEMIKCIEDGGNNIPTEILKQSPLFLSTYTYGKENNSLAYLVSLNMLLADLGEVNKWDFPYNYYPDRANPHPNFNYESNEFFREGGKLLYEKINYAEPDSVKHNGTD